MVARISGLMEWILHDAPSPALSGHLQRCVGFMGMWGNAVVSTTMATPTARWACLACQYRSKRSLWSLVLPFGVANGQVSMSYSDAITLAWCPFSPTGQQKTNTSLISADVSSFMPPIIISHLQPSTLLGMIINWLMPSPAIILLFFQLCSPRRPLPFTYSQSTIQPPTRAPNRVDISGLETAVQGFYSQGLALALATRRVYESAVRRFLTFCTSANLSLYPVSESTLCLFASHLATEGLKHQSIRGYLSGVRHFYISWGNPDP